MHPFTSFSCIAFLLTMLFTWYKIVEMWWEGVMPFLWVGKSLHYISCSWQWGYVYLEADSRFCWLHVHGNNLQVDLWAITPSFRSSPLMESHKWRAWWSERMKLPCEAPTAAKMLIPSPGPTGIHHGGHPPFAEKLTNKDMDLKMPSVLILTGLKDLGLRAARI